MRSNFTVLYCTALHCNALHCNALYCVQYTAPKSFQYAVHSAAPFSDCLRIGQPGSSDLILAFHWSREGWGYSPLIGESLGCCTVGGVQCSVQSIQFSVQSLHYTVCSLQCTVYNSQCADCSSECTTNSVQFTVQSCH